MNTPPTPQCSPDAGDPPGNAASHNDKAPGFNTPAPQCPPDTQPPGNALTPDNTDECNTTAPQCPPDDEPPENEATPSDKVDSKTPSSKTKKVPVWERLYNTETVSTTIIKAHARSSEKKVNVLSFSGSGGKMTKGSSDLRMHSPRTSYSPKTPSLSNPRGGSRTAKPRGPPANKITPPASGKEQRPKKTSQTKEGVPVWERLYGAQTETTARLKAHALSDEKKVKVHSFAGSGRKKVQ